MATRHDARRSGRRPFPPPFFSRASWGRTNGSLAARRGPRSGPANGRLLPEIADGLEESRRAKTRFGLPENTRGISCYEAGRDGFWLQRFFVRHGRENAVVDSASIEVHRRYRRAKTDRLDVPKLLTMLLRLRPGNGRAGVWYGCPAGRRKTGGSSTVHS